MGIAGSSYYASWKRQTTEKAVRKVKKGDVEIKIIEKIIEIKILHLSRGYRIKLLVKIPEKHNYQ